MKLQIVILLAATYAAAADICTSTKNPVLAQKLSKEIPPALKGRSGHHAVSFYDRTTETTCHLNAQLQFQTASVVKVAILSAAMHKCQKENKQLTPAQKTQAYKMITASDNDAATALWNWVTANGMKQFFGLVGMTQTTIDGTGWWGKTHTTSADQLKLLQMLTHANSVLTDPSRSYVLDLMSKTIASQRWGTPAGTPAGIIVHVKDGWVNRNDGVGWRINSLGTFNKPGKDYQIAVLTDGNPNEKYGHQTIEAVARVIHLAVGN